MLVELGVLTASPADLHSDVKPSSPPPPPTAAQPAAFTAPPAAFAGVEEGVEEGIAFAAGVEVVLARCSGGGACSGAVLSSSMVAIPWRGEGGSVHVIFRSETNVAEIVRTVRSGSVRRSASSPRETAAPSRLPRRATAVPVEAGPHVGKMDVRRVRRSGCSQFGRWRIGKRSTSPPVNTSSDALEPTGPSPPAEQRRGKAAPPAPGDASSSAPKP